MSEYWSGSITFTGLGSGTDFDSIIEATVSMESYRLNRMEAWGEQWTSKQEQIQELNTLLVSYKEALASMDSVDKFLVKSASSTSSAVGVTADAAALVGSHSVVVDQLAQNDIWSGSYGWSSTSDVLSASGGSFTLSYAGEDYTLDIPAGTTLQTFVNLVNANAGLNDGVRASLVNDGSSYHLQLRGMDLGADNTLEITGATGITGMGADDFVQTQTAQNAKLKVDGYPPGADEWIERDTNVISDVVEGLTLTLNDVTGSSGAKLSVVTDEEAIIANIEEFVSLTNEIRMAIDALESTDEEEYDDETTVFYNVRGNYGVDIIQQNLKNIISSVGVGFKRYDASAEEGDTYSSLAALGIATETDESSGNFGLLVIDYDELQEALDTDSDAVARLFSAESSGTSYTGDLAYSSSVEGITSAGMYDVSYEVSGGVLVGATINGNAAKVDPDTWTITGLSGNAEQGLVLTASNREDGTHGGDVAIRQGKINETIEELGEITDLESGILVIISDNYQQIIDNNKQDIADEEDRIARLQQRLVEQYARLEATLGEYENISTSLESLIADLE